MFVESAEQLFLHRISASAPSFILKLLMQLETTMVNQQERESGECSYQKGFL
jgi:hypothetical protein